MHVVIFSGGTVRLGKFTSQAIDTADLIIAADSGGRAAIDLGVFPATVIGDFDSLDQEARTELKQKGCQFITVSPDKDATDTELAIKYAVTQKASRITVIGGIEGDRLDHILTNIFLTIESEIPLKFVNGSTETWTELGPVSAKIYGAKNDLLSLIPLTSELSNVTTKHLKYSLNDETLWQNQARGVSNVLTENIAEISFKSGTLLVVHTTAD